MYAHLKGLFIPVPKEISSNRKVRVGRVSVSRGNSTGPGSGPSPGLRCASSDSGHVTPALSRQSSKKLSFVASPPNDSGTLLSRLAGALNNGLELSFVSCILPRLAATGYMPLYSTLAFYVLFAGNASILSLLFFVEKLLSQRATLALSVASSHTVGDSSCEADSDNTACAAGNSAVHVNNVSASRAGNKAAVTEIYPDSAEFAPPTLSSSQSFSGRNMLWVDEGCESMSNSPMMSLVLAIVTALLLLQLVALSLADPRRVRHRFTANALLCCVALRVQCLLGNISQIISIIEVHYGTASKCTASHCVLRHTRLERNTPLCYSVLFYSTTLLQHNPISLS